MLLVLVVQVVPWAVVQVVVWVAYIGAPFAAGEVTLNEIKPSVFHPRQFSFSTIDSVKMFIGVG